MITPLTYPVIYTGIISPISIYSKLLPEPIKINRSYLTIYNLLNITLNLYIMSGIYPCFAKDIMGNECNLEHIEYYAYLHIISNVIGFINTALYIMRHKWSKLTKLHLYHNGTIGMLWLYLIQSSLYKEQIGIYFGMLSGSYYNVIMYLHYTITGVGYKNPFKNFLKDIQVFPLLFTTIHSTFRIIYNNENNLFIRFI